MEPKNEIIHVQLKQLYFVRSCLSETRRDTSLENGQIFLENNINIQTKSDRLPTGPPGDVLIARNKALSIRLGQIL